MCMIEVKTKYPKDTRNSPQFCNLCCVFVCTINPSVSPDNRYRTTEQTWHKTQKNIHLSFLPVTYYQMTSPPKSMIRSLVLSDHKPRGSLVWHYTSLSPLSYFILPLPRHNVSHTLSPFTLSDSPSTLSVCLSLFIATSLSPYHSIPTSFTISSLSLFISLSTSSSKSFKVSWKIWIFSKVKDQDASESLKVRWGWCYRTTCGVIRETWLSLPEVIICIATVIIEK